MRGRTCFTIQGGFLLALVLGLLAILLGVHPVGAQAQDWEPVAVTSDQSRGLNTFDNFVYLPLAIHNHPEPVACAPIPGIQLGTLGVVNPRNEDAENSPDYNIYLRGWELTNAHKGLIDMGGPTDPNLPPQLYTLFGDQRTPILSNVYRVYDWDWGSGTRGGLITAWEVTMAGMQVTPAEIIHVPDSGYDIQYGYDAMVLYATENQITLKYTRDDHPHPGYKIHIEGICVEPSLLAHYQALDAAGRVDLPAVRGGEPLGRAWDTEIRVSITDCGSFMDPRVRKDWWRGR